MVGKLNFKNDYSLFYFMEIVQNTLKQMDIFVTILSAQSWR